MVEFPFGRCSKRCQIQNRPLQPGERYYSVAITGSSSSDAAEPIVRYDISASAWTGPPENAIGWWVNEMPRVDQVRVRPATPAELLDRLAMLCDDPANASLASLLATLMIRRRILLPNPNPSEDIPEGFEEYIHRGSNSCFHVPMVEPTAEEAVSLQPRLQNLLTIEVSEALRPDGLGEVA